MIASREISRCGTHYASRDHLLEQCHARADLPAGDPGMKLRIARLTPDRWSDLEAIFNAKGCSIARGCWCMAYRLSGSREPLPPGVTRAQANRAALKALVDAGNSPGLIGYRGKIPPVGSTVDLKNATWTNTIGAPALPASGRTRSSTRPSTPSTTYA